MSNQPTQKTFPSKAIKHLKHYQSLAISYIKRSRFIDNKEDKILNLLNCVNANDTSNYLLGIGVSITDVLQMIGKTLDEYEG